MRLALFFILFFLYHFSKGQELLPNPEFKKVNICCEYHVSCAPMGWWTCSGGTFNIEKNTFDKNGKLEYKPAIIRIKSELPEHRSFIQAPILCQLEKGKQYQVKLILKPRNYLPKKLGILLSDSFIIQKSTVIQIVDSISGLFRTYRVDSALTISPDTQVQLSKAFWPNAKIEITYNFIADSKEKFIVVGNFLGDEKTELQKILLHPKEKETLLEVYQVSLSKADNSFDCDPNGQLELLETLNRRHTFYGACSDTTARNMNQLFRHWQAKVEEKTRIINPILGKHYKIDGIFFKLDSFTLLNNSFKTLDSLVNVLNESKIKFIKIEGHTDSIGSAEYNESLSLNRAKAVAEYIREKLPGLTISIEGFGSRVPAYTNSTEKGRSLNRRVEIIFLSDED